VSLAVRSPRQDFEAELSAELWDLSARWLRRGLRLPAGIDLVSNDYLGLAGHPALRERMREALLEGPAGSGGSRLLRGHHAAFDRIEERLAAFSGQPAALLFGSGWAANLGLLPAIAGRDDLVLSDALNHASLIDGVRLSGARRIVYPHLDVQAVRDGLRQGGARRRFVVTESVFSMDGDLAPLRELAEAAEEHGALLIVDEAHATGLYGSGRVEALGLQQRVLASVHTGGKALGCAGAWVAGPAALRDTLLQRARSFVFSTAPLPALCAGLDAALDVLAAEPWRAVECLRKAGLLRGALREAGLTAPGEAPIVPLVVGGNAAALALQDALQAEGFDVRAIRPPTVPEGTARLRLTVRTPVADADLLRLAGAAGRSLR
jgi:8-amino-7-oxononanoate synthase